jgi:hypothetical protein
VTSAASLGWPHSKAPNALRVQGRRPFRLEGGPRMAQQAATTGSTATAGPRGLLVSNRLGVSHRLGARGSGRRVEHEARSWWFSSRSSHDSRSNDRSGATGPSGSNVPPSIGQSAGGFRWGQSIPTAPPAWTGPPERRSTTRRKAALLVTPEFLDPVGALEVGEDQDVEQFGAGSGPRASRRSRRRRSTSSRLMAGRLRRSTVVPSIGVPAQVHSRTLAHHGSPFPDRPLVPVSSAARH